MAVDEKAQKVLNALKRKIRPYTEADLAMATGMSKRVVRKRCNQLLEARLVRKHWAGTNGPYWEVSV